MPFYESHINISSYIVIKNHHCTVLTANISSYTKSENYIDDYNLLHVRTMVDILESCFAKF